MSAANATATSAATNAVWVSTITLDMLPTALQAYIKEKASVCKPESIYVCDGSENEFQALLKQIESQGQIMKLTHMKNCWLALTDPKDVARVESRTVISTRNQRDTIPTPRSGFKQAPESLNLRNLKMTALGNWLSPDDFQYELGRRLPGCMRGRTMYVIPYSMGPVGGPISKIGVELTDSAYVVCSMRIMTRMGKDVVDELTTKGTPCDVKCLHSVGVPLPTERKLVNNWPCNPEMTMVGHEPDNNEVTSFGSGYGGNSLLGKKCFALRLGSVLANREGWLAEHMLIVGITNPQGVKKYIAAAFPSACGKTNLAMLTPTLPGWKLECVGDDIAWMKFDQDGVLRAINPEAGFFGVCPGTSSHTNLNALKTIQYNTIFTNVAHTADGGVYWEGLDDSFVEKDEPIISWKGQEWHRGDKEPAAQPNSRFCAPANQCPIIDALWKDPQGVPISAIIFGGRRPHGIPLVYESLDWEHGVFVGSTIRSEATAAAEFKGKVIMHDPFSMRPFFGYNFGDYMAHWLSLNKPGRQLPKIFHVNWFRKSSRTGEYLWPGFGDNIHVLDWVFRRCENQTGIVRTTALGNMPTVESFNVDGLNVAKEDMEELFALDKQFLSDEAAEIRAYLDENVNESTPKEIYRQLELFEERIKQMQ